MKKVRFTSNLFFSIVFATFNACNLECQNTNSQKNNNVTISNTSTILEKEVQSPILQINKNLNVAISDPVKLICDRRKNKFLFTTQKDSLDKRFFSVYFDAEKLVLVANGYVTEFTVVDNIICDSNQILSNNLDCMIDKLGDVILIPSQIKFYGEESSEYVDNLTFYITRLKDKTLEVFIQNNKTEARLIFNCSKTQLLD